MCTMILCIALSGGCLRGGYSLFSLDARSSADHRSSTAETSGESPVPRDAAPPADLAAGCLRASGCVECAPLERRACPAACEADDCDDLPQALDPWPDRCNQIAFAEDFSDPATPLWNKYHEGKPQPNTITVERCGLLRMHTVAHHTIWAWPQDAALGALKRGYLFEAGVVVPADQSEIMLSADAAPADPYVGPSAFRACSLVNKHGQLTLHANVKTDGYSAGKRTDVAISSSWVRLQTWLVGSEHRCRIAAPDLPIAELSIPVEVAPPVGTIMLMARNNLETGVAKDLEIDFVRVFQPE